MDLIDAGRRFYLWSGLDAVALPYADARLALDGAPRHAARRLAAPGRGGRPGMRTKTKRPPYSQPRDGDTAWTLPGDPMSGKILWPPVKNADRLRTLAARAAFSPQNPNAINAAKPR